MTCRVPAWIGQAVSSAKRFNPVTAAANYAASQQPPRAWSDRRGDCAASPRVVGPAVANSRLNNFPASPLDNSESSIKCDDNFARICMGIHHAPLLQRWAPLHELARLTKRQGFTRLEFDAVLSKYGIKGGRTYTNRLLKRGNHLYWEIDPNTGLIYPTGFVELTQRILRIAAALGQYDLFLNGNHPGARRPMYIDVSGTCDDFEGAILATWYHAHNGMPLSRYTISALFNRDRRAIWRLERIANIEIIYNETETTDPAEVPLNQNGDPRGDVYITRNRCGQTVYHFRMANSYAAPSAIRQHPYKGQGRRAAYSFEQWLDSISLHGNREAGGIAPVKLNQVGRVYCENDKTVKRSRKRGNTGALYIRWRPGRGRGIVWRVSISHDMQYR